jgi:hypothetical protein
MPSSPHSTALPTKVLNQAVKRNSERFPADFMFRSPLPSMRLVKVTDCDRYQQAPRWPRFPPYAFTEHGADHGRFDLRQPRAVEMSVYVVRAFVKLRELFVPTGTRPALRAARDATGQKAHRARSRHRRHPLRDPRADAPLSPKRRGIGFTADLGREVLVLVAASII